MADGAARIRNAYESLPYSKTFSDLEKENEVLRDRIVELEGLLEQSNNALGEASKQVKELQGIVDRLMNPQPIGLDKLREM